jgi:hypothetical protein
MRQRVNHIGVAIRIAQSSARTTAPVNNARTVFASMCRIMILTPRHSDRHADVVDSLAHVASPRGLMTECSLYDQPLLLKYHRIHPTQSTWGDAQKLMSRWRGWGHYNGTCNSSECDYNIRVEDMYGGWIKKLSEKNQRRIYNFPFPMIRADRIGYRTSEMDVHFLVLDGKIVCANSSMLIIVADSGPPDHFAYPILITAQTRSNLSEYPRSANHEPGVMGFGVAQLDLHPDYQVYRPSSSKTGIIDRIAYTPTLPFETLVQLTRYTTLLALPNCIPVSLSVISCLLEGAGNFGREGRAVSIQAQAAVRLAAAPNREPLHATQPPFSRSKSSPRYPGSGHTQIAIADENWFKHAYFTHGRVPSAIRQAQ